MDGFEFELPEERYVLPVTALEAMAARLLTQVLDAQLGWNANDEGTPEQASVYIRTAQATHEQFLRRFGILRSRT